MKPRSPCRQRGGVAIMFALTLAMLLGVCGLALELSLAFQRQGQLQRIADTAALTAAQQLDGTAGAIATAYGRAAQAANAAEVRGAGPMFLSTAALAFASDPDGPWLTYAAAQGAPAGLRYVRADTAALDPLYGTLASPFQGLLGNALAQAALSAQAVAGPRGVRVLPLAVCAMSAAASAVRAHGGGLNEVVEYGFRHGVAYNLLKLNPAAGAATGEYFLVDPVSPPGSSAQAAGTDDAQVAPFMCNGQLAYPTLAGGALNLRRPASFNLWQQLNARFGVYGGANACDPYAAPPDTNVRAYVGAQASWMNSAPPQASAESSTPQAGQPLATIADAAPPLPAVAPERYGTLWAYGPARRTSLSFGTGHWGTLYPAAPALAASGWLPTQLPYKSSSYSTSPALPGRKERRLLHVPLLACPVAPGALAQAEPLAVARFLLVAQASATEVPAEFAGIVSEQTLATDVELLR